MIILKQIKQSETLNFTTVYEKDVDQELDFRTKFNKNALHQSSVKQYFQVFSDRNEFIPNLSIVDLLFNQGPQTKSYL